MNVSREKMMSSHGKQTLKSQVKHKAQIPVPQPYHNPLYELQGVYEQKNAQVESPEYSQKTHMGSDTSKEDELVKYMSKIPGYLQQVEKGESFQERALNFGVLDFKRLEKWKYNERMPGRCHRKFPSSSSGSLSAARRPPRLSGTPQVKQPSQGKLYTNSSHERKLSEGAQQFQRRFEKSPDAPCGTTYGDKKFLHRKVKSSRRDQTRFDGSFSEIDTHKSRWKELDEKPLSKLKASSVKQDTPAKIDIARTCSAKNNVVMKEECGLTHRRHLTEPQNIVLLVPKNSSKLSGSESSQFVESRSSCDAQFEILNVSKLSDCFSSREPHSGEPFSEVQHSCPLPTFDSVIPTSAIKLESSLTTTRRVSDVSMASCPNEMLISPSTMEGKGPNSDKAILEPHSGDPFAEVPHSCPLPTFVTVIPTSAIKLESSLITPRRVSDVSMASCPNEMLISPSTMEGKGPNSDKAILEPSVPTKSSKKMDMEATEQQEVKGRHPSPNRRFSFSSLGRLSRSLSFKDSSAVPELSSNYATIKSGPISTETAAGTGNCSRDKASTNGRARSSPLRRLLNPLMKPRGKHSSESVQPMFGIKNLVSPRPMDSSESVQVKINDVSSYQALLQLTVKNDLPFFKLVVDSSNDIMAATLKDIQKDNLSLTYAFYSVHEIKKKSVGWMSQGSKSKSCSFGYNTIGQMKMSNSYTSDSNAPGSSNMWLVTECSLYDLDPREEGVKTHERLTRTEVAAIILKKPVEIPRGEQQANEDIQRKQNHLPSPSGHNKNFSSTTVILPGGLHSLPSKGAPSSLIDRWRSGGLCDCGGWDIGCKLRILTNLDTSSKNTTQTTNPSTCMNLFTQGGEPESKPIFSLAPFKNGLYSVEFNASVSLLEAFSISVAIITTSKFSGILELRIPLEAKQTSQMATGSDTISPPTTNQGQLPAKYVRSPPPSPVGRI